MHADRFASNFNLGLSQFEESLLKNEPQNLFAFSFVALGRRNRLLRRIARNWTNFRMHTVIGSSHSLGLSLILRQLRKVEASLSARNAKKRVN